jgi:hypothetical protein
MDDAISYRSPFAGGFLQAPATVSVFAVLDALTGFGAASAARATLPFSPHPSPRGASSSMIISWSFASN